MKRMISSRRVLRMMLWKMRVSRIVMNMVVMTTKMMRVMMVVMLGMAGMAVMVEVM